MTTSRQKTEDATINLTPMIDVVFLLVIFFLVGSEFSEAESKIPVNVPTAGQMQAITRGPDELLVEIAVDDSVSLNGETMSLDSLTTKLKQSHANYPDAKAIVRGEASGSLQRTVEVLQVVRRSGIENIGISTKRMNR